MDIIRQSRFGVGFLHDEAFAILLVTHLDLGEGELEGAIQWKKNFGLNFGLKNGLRFHFDSETCLNYPFMNNFLV